MARLAACLPWIFLIKFKFSTIFFMNIYLFVLLLLFEHSNRWNWVWFGFLQNTKIPRSSYPGITQTERGFRASADDEQVDCFLDSAFYSQINNKICFSKIKKLVNCLLFFRWKSHINSFVYWHLEYQYGIWVFGYTSKRKKMVSHMIIQLKNRNRF